MTATKAQTVVSALISQGLQVQAIVDTQNEWTVIVVSDNPIQTQVVETFRANQGLTATVKHVVLT